jgi:3-deoxy-D-manno-octulosonic-acid transferase
MGVLPDWYAAADITFVGGSLVPIGGHNLLEAAAAGRPVLCGPHTFHAPEVTRALLEAGGARVVVNEGEMRAQLAAWLEDPAAAAAVGAKAAAAVTANQGAARRALQLFRESASSARSGSG